MNEPALLFTGAGMTALWGIMHLFPTSAVVKGFGPISADNRNIILMEWIVEGISLVFIGVLVTSVALIGARSAVSTAVYALSAAFLSALAGVSLFTGFKVRFLPFRLCPFIFTLSAILILIGGVV